jgi:hypothetical protein
MGLVKTSPSRSCRKRSGDELSACAYRVVRQRRKAPEFAIALPRIAGGAGRETLGQVYLVSAKVEAEIADGAAAKGQVRDRLAIGARRSRSNANGSNSSALSG